MILRTELAIPLPGWSIGLGDPVLTLGSCFAQSIGQRFITNKFQALVNPFGTTYHPIGIHKLLLYAAYQEYPIPHTYLENQGTAFNYDFHSSLSALTASELQRQVQERISAVHYFLKDCKVLILTYGTAWLYERTDTGEPVSNCHRMNATLFSKRLVTAEEMVSSFRQLASVLLAMNPDMRVILTVSPVRHVRDTLPLNAVSKSALRVACHQMAEEVPAAEYFPAFELMMDELRDYRFYKDDLIHPSSLAEDFIWEKFSGAYFTESTRKFMKEWEAVQRAVSHKPFHPSSDAYQQFLGKTLNQLEDMKSVINVDREVMEIKSRQIAPYS